MKFAVIFLPLIISCSTSEQEKVGHISPLPKKPIVKISKFVSRDESLRVCEEQIKIEKMSTEAEILRAFETYKVIDPPTLHDRYIWSECIVVGTIIHESKTYNWKWRVGNLLETDFPDGVQKILGGSFTDGQE